MTEASSTVEAAAESFGPAVVQEARRVVLAERIRDSEDVIRAEFALLRHMEPNPRQIKRFDNAFRLQLYVAVEDPDCQLEFTLEQLVALGKWVLMSLRWPELTEDIGQEPQLLATLEAEANEKGSAANAELERLMPDYQRWFENRQVAELLKAAEGEPRVTQLEPGSFLRCA